MKFTKTLASLLGALVLTGCGKREIPTRQAEGLYQNYKVSVFEFQDENKDEKNVLLTGTDKDEYSFVRASYKRGKLEVIEATSSDTIFPVNLRYYPSTDFFHSLYGERDKKEFERLKKLVSDAERKAK